MCLYNFGAETVLQIVPLYFKWKTFSEHHPNPIQFKWSLIDCKLHPGNCGFPPFGKNPHQDKKRKMPKAPQQKTNRAFAHCDKWFILFRIAKRRVRPIILEVEQLQGRRKTRTLFSWLTIECTPAKLWARTRKFVLAGSRKKATRTRDLLCEELWTFVNERRYFWRIAVF